MHRSTDATKALINYFIIFLDIQSSNCISSNKALYSLFLQLIRCKKCMLFPLEWITNRGIACFFFVEYNVCTEARWTSFPSTHSQDPKVPKVANGASVRVLHRCQSYACRLAVSRLKPHSFSSLTSFLREVILGLPLLRLPWGVHPGGVEILLVLSCYGNWDKLLGHLAARFPHSPIHLLCIQFFVYWKQWTEQ